jgi:hypothetical protein
MQRRNATLFAHTRTPFALLDHTGCSAQDQGPARRVALGITRGGDFPKFYGGQLFCALRLRFHEVMVARKDAALLSYLAVGGLTISSSFATGNGCEFGSEINIFRVKYLLCNVVPLVP